MATGPDIAGAVDGLKHTETGDQSNAGDHSGPNPARTAPFRYLGPARA